MTNLFEPPANGDSPRKPWPFPASALHSGPHSLRAGGAGEPGSVEDRGLCSPAKRSACNPQAATCAGAEACRAAAGGHVPVLLRGDRPAACA